jgi:hypothetical protein
MRKIIEKILVERSFVFASLIAVALSSVTLVCTAQERRVVRETTSGANAKSDAGLRQHSSHSDTESTWTSGRDTVKVKARNLELTDDGQAVKSLQDGGHLFITEQRGDASREMKITQAANGDFEYNYSVNGSPKAFDAGARTWLSNLLLEFVRSSGFASERRVAWLFKRGGADAVFSEVSLLPSDNIKRAYLQKLVEQEKLGASDMIKVLEKAMREVTSDYELTEFLIAVKGRIGTDGEVRAAFQRTLERLQSDYDRGRVLTAVAGTGN